MGTRIKHIIQGIEELPEPHRKKLRDKTRGLAYRELHPDRVKENSRQNSRRQRLEKKFNLTIPQYEAMLRNQKGACALCGFTPSGTNTFREGRSLAVDHDHITGQVRGLLYYVICAIAE